MTNTKPIPTLFPIPNPKPTLDSLTDKQKVILIDILDDEHDKIHYNEQYYNDIKQILDVVKSAIQSEA